MSKGFAQSYAQVLKAITHSCMWIKIIGKSSTRANRSKNDQIPADLDSKGLQRGAPMFSTGGSTLSVGKTRLCKQ
jgi:hypothetical protein